MNERKSKNIVIIALCITLIFMGVGFSLLSQQLTINGSASVDATSDWDVEIYDIVPVKAVIAGAAVDSNDLDDLAATPSNNAIPEGKLGTVTKTSTTGTFAVNFVQPGDYVVYEITTKNLGTIAAQLVSALTSDNTVTTGISYTADPQYTSQQDANEGHIFSYAFGTYTNSTFTAAALTPASYTLATTNSTNTFYVRVMYNDTEVNPGDLSSSQKTSSATITFVYEQA